MNTKESQVTALMALIKEFDPQRLTQEVARQGETWADADAGASSLEETRRTLLAQITLEYSSGTGIDRNGKPKQVSMAQAETCALADERYTAHLDLMVNARKIANVGRVRYDMGKMKLELMRSLQATVRQEMKMAGML